jgi:hypothetical protein
MSRSKISIALAATALLVSVLFATPVGQAAGRIVLPKSSVGTAQLKRNAVTGAKVKNGSLLAADFKAGQLPAGPQGPKGDTGAVGAHGEKGDTGPSNGYIHPWTNGAVYIDTPQGNTVATLGLPAGEYLVFAKTRAATNFNGTALVQCTLTAGNGYDLSSTELHATSNNTGLLTLNIGANLASAGLAKLWCHGLATSTWAADAVVSAVKVGQLAGS